MKQGLIVDGGTLECQGIHVVQVNKGQRAGGVRSFTTRNSGTFAWSRALYETDIGRPVAFDTSKRVVRTVLDMKVQ